MLKNLRIGSKLILVGTLLMVIPLAVVTIVAVQRPTLAITGIETEQLGRGARHIAGSVNSVIQEGESAAIKNDISHHSCNGGELT